MMTNPPRRTLLVSIRPKYAALIFSRHKTVELRRTRPAVQAGDRLVIYVSTPQRQLAGSATVDSVECARPSALWRRINSCAGVPRSVFDDYFANAQVGYGIRLSSVVVWQPMPSLDQLRAWMPGFCPPQTYRYLSETEYNTIRTLVRTHAAAA